MTWKSAFQGYRRHRWLAAITSLLLNPWAALTIWNDAESGEGVISTAIVVMIMAFLAVGVWVAFKAIMSNATNSIATQVSQIGQ